MTTYNPERCTASIEALRDRLVEQSAGQPDRLYDPWLSFVLHIIHLVLRWIVAHPLQAEAVPAEQQPRPQTAITKSPRPKTAPKNRDESPSPRAAPSAHQGGEAHILRQASRVRSSTPASASSRAAMGLQTNRRNPPFPRPMSSKPETRTSAQTRPNSYEIITTF